MPAKVQTNNQQSMEDESAITSDLETFNVHTRRGVRPFLRTLLDKFHHHLSDPAGLAAKDKNSFHFSGLEVFTHDGAFAYTRSRYNRIVTIPYRQFNALESPKKSKTRPRRNDRGARRFHNTLHCSWKMNLLLLFILPYINLGISYSVPRNPMYVHTYLRHTYIRYHLY